MLHSAPRTATAAVPRARRHQGPSPTAARPTGLPPDLALGGDAVRRIIAPAPESRVREALHWLESQVDDNPQLNTPEALTALLRFRPAP